MKYQKSPKNLKMDKDKLMIRILKQLDKNSQVS